MDSLFRPVDGRRALKRSPDEARIYLYAVIVAQACNLGIAAMAKASRLSEDQLNWYTHWYLQEESLNTAITSLVNFQHHQTLSDTNFKKEGTK